MLKNHTHQNNLKNCQNELRESAMDAEIISLISAQEKTKLGAKKRLIDENMMIILQRVPGEIIL